MYIEQNRITVWDQVINIGISICDEIKSCSYFNTGFTLSKVIRLGLV
jgi:hypothetical protein